jgi:hypothetical protein
VRFGTLGVNITNFYGATFYVQKISLQLFRTHISGLYVIGKKISWKIALKNIGEIDIRCQLQPCHKISFVIQADFLYLGFYFIDICKLSEKPLVRKMLVNLTPNLHFRGKFHIFASLLKSNLIFFYCHLMQSFLWLWRMQQTFNSSQMPYFADDGDILCTLLDCRLKVNLFPYKFFYQIFLAVFCDLKH